MENIFLKKQIKNSAIELEKKNSEIENAKNPQRKES